MKIVKDAPTCCTVDECEERRYCRGWCTKHYQRWRKHGDPQAPPGHSRHSTAEYNFLLKIDRSGDCWTWLGRRTSYGYGSFYVDGKQCGAHRYSYELFVGPIPAGKVIDHVCHNRACVRPDHLRTATPGQNNENHSGRAQRNSKSGVRGVSWSEKDGKWVARVVHNGSVVYSQYFTDLREAERAVRGARCQHFTRNDADRGID